MQYEGEVAQVAGGARRPHGQGTMVYGNGDEYSGGWRDGKRSGEGLFT